MEKTINEAAACFGINSNALGYIVDGESNEAKLCSVFKNMEKGTAIPAELFESYGTIRFVNMFPLVVNALLNGCLLYTSPACASPIPRFAQVVVLPTPPFWLAMAIICVFISVSSCVLNRRWNVKRVNYPLGFS